MHAGRFLIIGAAGWVLSASPALAQVAAESAVLNSTTGAATARGGRTLGSATSGAMERAAGAIRGRSPARGQNNRRGRRAGNQAGVTIGTGDVLEGSDAETHMTESGATLRVSGGLRPRATPAKKPAEAAAED